MAASGREGMGGMDDDMGSSDDAGDNMAMPAASTALKTRMIIVSVVALAITLWIVTTFAPGA